MTPVNGMSSIGAEVKGMFGWARLVWLAALVAVGFVGLAGAAAIRWGPSHGPEGGSVSALAVNPQNSAIVYAAPAQGVFKSTDGGRSWRAAGLATRNVHVIVVDPLTPATLYAGVTGGAIFKSTNAGRTWRALTTGTTRSVTALVIDPQNPETIYVGTWLGGVFKSTDGGKTWGAVSTGLRKGVRALAIDPQTPNTLFAGTESSGTTAGSARGGIFKTVDAGRTWRPVKTGSIAGVYALAVDSSRPAMVYACAQGGTSAAFFVSANGGEDWSAKGEPGGGCHALVLDPSTPARIYAATGNVVQKSGDGGESWRIASEGLPDSWTVTALAIDPQQPEILFAAPDGFGVFRSTNGARSWRAVNAGLIGSRVVSLVVDPERGATVYAGTAGGLYRSATGGLVWRSANAGLEGHVVEALAIDRQATSTLYAGTGYGVFTSRNAGRTWRKASTGLPGGELLPAVPALAVDPKMRRTIYAGIGPGWFVPRPGRRGVFKSTDGGRSWQPANAGMAGMLVDVLAIDPRRTATLYAGASMVVRRLTYPVGVFKSTDGGRTWRSAGLAKRQVLALAVDPRTPALVYAGVWGREGVLKSTDGGRTWRAANNGLRSMAVASLVIDPENADTLFASTGYRGDIGRGVFRTTNGGKSWHPFSQGLTTLSVAALAIDSTGRMLYAGTGGGGVFTYRLGG